MKKVLTVTLNPCIDRTLYFESFQVGTTNIIKKTIEEAAGKGINVAVGLRHLQVPVKALGFAYNEDMDKLYGKLDAEQIPYSFVEVEGRLRVNQKLFDEAKSEMTECNEKGSPVSKGDVDMLLQLLQAELADASILVLSGSVPPGVDKDIYAVMTSMANKAGVKVILDASGELLAEGIKAKPYLIKPNKEEFIKTFIKGMDGTKIPCINERQEPEDIIEMMADQIVKQGVSYVCLSMGEAGAIMWNGQKNDNGETGAVVKEKRPAINVPIRSLQGAGDAMVAGLCKALYDKREDKMLDYALAMAASTIALEGTRMGNLKR